MKKLRIADISLYRWRYVITYIVIAAIFTALLLLVGLLIPGGISQREMNAVVASGALSLAHLTPDMVVNLPYYALQQFIFEHFGVTTLTIKLPTIIFAFLTGVGVLLLLRKWFRQNVAILTSILALIIGPFLLAAQSGSPGILYIMWPVWILCSASMISRRATPRIFWKIILFISVALSLYTPLSIYVLAALLSAVILHPHLRYIAKQLNRAWITLACIFGLAAAMPLIIGIVNDPSIILRLLGFSGSISPSDSFSQLVSQYLMLHEPVNGIVMTPVYSLPILIIILLGIYRIYVARHTARSYILTAWIVLLIPALVTNPQLINVTFVPAILLTGYGIEFILRSWYTLFPKNPYARVAGLIPIAILIASLVVTGVDRFMYGYVHGTAQTHIFTKDLALLNHTTHTHTQNVHLVVDADEQEFYRTIARYNPSWSIASVEIATNQPISHSSHDTLVTRQAHAHTTREVHPSHIITDSAREQADRFYLYKKTTQ